MITQCPSCRTHFRVHQEQLSARAGQVRCGKCSRIFDALEYLVDGFAQARKPAQSDEQTSTQATAAVAPEPAPPETAPDAAGETSIETLPPTIASMDDPVQPTDADAAVPETMVAAQEQMQKADPATETSISSFEFGPNAAADTATRTRRWPWLLGAALLLVGLFVQAAYYYRSALIVLFPEVKPYAAELCAKLHCDLPLPRRIELMSIDASDLQADTTNPNVMVLSATLKNRAIFAQQLPMLELTLTNAQDQPVVRRVLTPQNYIGKTANVQAGFAANAEMAIKVFIEGSQVKATGYRLYLFYP